MFRTEHNLETGEVIEIPLTPAEIKEFEAKVKENQKIEAEQIAKYQEEVNKKTSLLEKLGITAEEAALLLS